MVVGEGSQIASKELDLCAYANSTSLNFSRPGKPTDIAFAQSFNAVVRLEDLAALIPQNWIVFG
jgi:putative transposase